MDRVDFNDGVRVLKAIDEGGLPPADVYAIVRDFDPLYTYFLMRYLREKNPINEYSSGGGERLLALVGTYDDLGKLLKSPPKDSLIEWFDDSHSMQEFFNDPDQFVQLIVDKLEG